MFLFPLPFLLTWLVGLLSLGLLGGGAYLAYAWTTGVVVGTVYLVASLAMLLFSLAGRFIILALLGRPGSDEPRLTRLGEPQRVVGADGTELAVEVAGPADGQPIIFINGWGLRKPEWTYAHHALADRFRLIFWDLRGLGESSRPANEDYHLERMAGDLRAVLDVAGDKRAILVGHSIGGMLILTFCRLFRADVERRVDRIALVHTTYTNPVRTTTASRLFTAIQGPVLRPLNYLTIALSPLVWLMNGLSYLNGTLHLLVVLLGYGGRQTRQQVDFIARCELLTPPSVASRGSLAMLDYDETATLPTIPVPALVVAGDRDRLTRPQASVTLQAAIPDAELTLLTPAGHLGLLEQHTAFIDSLTAFVSSPDIVQESSWTVT